MKWTMTVWLAFTLIVVSLGDNMSHKCMDKNCKNDDADHADNSEEENDKDGHMEDHGGRMLAVVIPVAVAIVIILTVVSCCVYIKQRKQRMTKTKPDFGKGEIVSIAILPDSVTECNEKKPLPESNYWNPPSSSASAPPTFNYLPAYHSDTKLPPAYFPVLLDTMMQPPPPYSKI